MKANQNKITKHKLRSEKLGKRSGILQTFLTDGDLGPEYDEVLE